MTEARPFGHFLIRVDRSPVAPQDHREGDKNQTVVDGRLDLVHDPVLGLRHSNWKEIVDGNQVEDEPDAKLELSGGTLTVQSQKTLELEAKAGVEVANLHLAGTVSCDNRAISGLSQLEAKTIKARHGATYNRGLYPSEPGYLAPKNIIVMWSGSEDAIPPGWVLCDGNYKEGVQTPDLRGRFIVGRGSGPGRPSYSRYGFAGNPDLHSHFAQIPELSFTTWTAGAHSHAMPGSWYARGVSCGRHTGLDTGSGKPPWVQTQTAGGHTHTGKTSPKGTTTHQTPGTDLNRPKWYVLCFLMKT